MSKVAVLSMETDFDEEEARLEELRSYEILDTPTDAAFDRLTQLAARHLGMPIALISLVDSDRQWFKSRHGFGATETSRDIAFCAHAILQDEVMIVVNATADARFADNPLVTGAPDVVFYAGAPLITRNGYKLGTLCVIDHVPRPDFGAAQKTDLEEMASIVMDEMEWRLSARLARQDVETLRESQSVLKRQYEMVERTTQEKLNFITTISHELRTPMNGILGMAYLLGDTPLNELQQDYIDTIDYCAHNLLLLINDVLDLSKIEAGQLILEKAPFNIKTSFGQILKLLDPLARKQGSTLVCHIDPRLPDMVVGDVARFSQIVTNLVGNAIKFTEQGTIDASIKYDTEAQTLLCEIIDTGIGIPEDRHDAVFERFIQSDASIAQKYGGTGLGLSITKHLVLMLGGRIDFTSEKGVGSRFWFTLPVILPHENISYTENTPAPDHDDLPDTSQSWILIAEDHPVSAFFLTSLLRKYGFARIDVAEDGLAVMERLRNMEGGRSYDAILMDCKMPEQDGYDTTRLIRAEEQAGTRHIPIIAMTANAMAGDREICFASGMDGYVTKPVQPERLKTVLTQWFRFPAPKTAAIYHLKSMHTHPPIDISRLEMVAESDDMKILLMTTFFTLADKITATMETARREEEAEIWRNAAHSLKGSAANMGMADLQHLCHEAERTEGLTYEQRSVLLQNIQNELGRVKTFAASLNPAFVGDLRATP